MELLLDHPSGFALEHQGGKLFRLRFRTRDLLGPFTLLWDLSGLEAHAEGFSSEQLELSGLHPDPAAERYQVRLKYRELRHLHAEISLRLTARGLELTPHLAHVPEAGAAPIRLEAFRVSAIRLEQSFLRGIGEAAGWRFFPLAYNSFSPAYVRDSRAVLPMPRFFTAGTFNQHTDSCYWGRWSDLSSPWMAALQASSGPETLLVGWLSARHGLGEIALRRRSPTELEARLDFGGRRLGPGEEVTGDTLELAFSSDGEALIQGWTEEAGQRMQARLKPRAVPSGWCSWYHYYTRIDEAELLRNLETLATTREVLPVDCVQLDDGYQVAIGDWLSPNRKFPSGLKHLAQKIRAAGYMPGIWTAPFLVQRSSSIFRSHPEWLLKNRDGKLERFGYHPIWGVIAGQVYCLDPTHPQVLEYLHRVYSTLVEFGFELFKIDFLNAGLRPGQHYDPHLSPVEGFRLGLETIRAAVGEHFILGCGAPLMPAIGVVDGMRISSDVKEAWQDPTLGFIANGNGHPAAELSILNAITRAHLHQRWWLNDPDCLLVREQRSSLKLVEIHTLLTVLSLTGGMLMLSDDLSRLEPQRAALAQLALPARGSAARALGLLEEERPARFVRSRLLDDGGEEALAAIINWSDALQEPLIRLDALGLPEGAYHAFEFWTRTYRKLEPGRAFPVVLDPHECALLLLRPCREHPQLVTATHHLGQTTVMVQEERWDGTSCTLFLKLELGAKRSGEVWISVPEGLRVRAVKAGEGAILELERYQGACLVLGVRLELRGALAVTFEQVK